MLKACHLYLPVYATKCCIFPLRCKSSISNVNWNLGRLNHIAIATPDLDSSTKFYRDVLKAKVSDPVSLPDHGVITVFVDVHNTKLELLKPLGEMSPING
ncbi:Methylmalonyl-CoA epimerase, mitochondrial [Armadillidium nasatum]|uniref:Methylmalonyl-CoA epimerase, mitochondrial n=1 Tax=Armadillidium nasatum TaxID=96803 RepID=A0A5N5SML7_9CRUS|nr:Methylmalonyl-CoA epimerase, mitochondrial [Armadillidium nasatum]